METVRLEDRPSFITADGSSIRELAGVPTGNAANQSLAEATVPPGGETAEHFHRTSEEIYLFTAGRDDAPRRRGGPVRAGDSVVIAPGTPHKLSTPGRAARAAVLLRARLLARGHRPHRRLTAVRRLLCSACAAAALLLCRAAASAARAAA